MPASQCCSCYVMLGGETIISSSTLLTSTLYLLFSLVTQSLNSCNVIHVFLLAAYPLPGITLSTPFNHLGLAAFLMTSGLIFSPVALEQSKYVRLSLECLHPLHESLFTTRDWEDEFEKWPCLVSIVLQSSREQPFSISLSHPLHSANSVASTSAASPLRTTSFIPNVFLHDSSQPLDAEILKYFKQKASRSKITVFVYHKSHMFNCKLCQYGTLWFNCCLQLFRLVYYRLL